MSIVSPYPDYNRLERLADAAVHGIGIGAALVGITGFVVFYAPQMSWGLLIATLIYATGLLLMLSASAVYHMTAHTAYRPLLRRIDHAAIYLKIAATATPLAVILGTTFAYEMLALIWGLAGFGAVAKLTVKPGKMTTPCWPYLALGWLGVVLLVPLAYILPESSLRFLVVGGIIYSAAVIFFWWESLPYANAIWHACVVLASACFFSGITSAIISI